MPSPAAVLDRRRTAARPDLARCGLEGRVSADRFIEGHAAQIRHGVAPVRRAPRADAPLDTEALFGESLCVLDEAHGWAWVQLDIDGYVGYVPSASLTSQTTQPTHRIKPLATFVYPQPDIKTPPLLELAMGSPIAIVEVGEKFSTLAGGGFVATRHTMERDRFERDFVDVAERYAGSPYLWGGRTRRGLDCSGLVQTAMQAAGLAAPRDSDMQQAEIGLPVLVPDDLEGLQRGDLVFWPGHVGIMADEVILLHANAHHMAVVAEPLTTAVQRIERGGAQISEIRRPDALAALQPVAPRAQAG